MKRSVVIPCAAIYSANSTDGESPARPAGIAVSSPMWMRPRRKVPAVITMARQVGAVLGVSVLIVLLDSAGSDPLGAFDNGWLVLAGASVLAGITCLGLRVSPETAPEPAPAELAGDPLVAPAAEHA